MRSKKVRPPGIEPGSSGWKPEILTTILRARCKNRRYLKEFFSGIEKI